MDVVDSEVLFGSRERETVIWSVLEGEGPENDTIVYEMASLLPFGKDNVYSLFSEGEYRHLVMRR